MTVQITQPGQVAIVQVPGNWSPKQIRQEQTRVNNQLKRTEAPVHVVIVGGGEAVPTAEELEQLLEDEDLEDEDREQLTSA